MRSVEVGAPRKQLYEKREIRSVVVHEAPQAERAARLKQRMAVGECGATDCSQFEKCGEELRESLEDELLGVARQRRQEPIVFDDFQKQHREGLEIVLVRLV